MSREIKFRAWDGTEMYTPIIGQNGEIFRSYRSVEDFDYAPHDDVMQYTGLKDIYEGDILDCLYPERGEHGDIIDYSNYKGVVVWDESTYKFILKCTLGNEYLEHLLRPSVIGNIFETPELIHGT